MKWQNPPRDYRDECDEIVEQLKAEPGRWALIKEDSTEIEQYSKRLEAAGMETRYYNFGNYSYGPMRMYVVLKGDLYARCPQ